MDPFLIPALVVCGAVLFVHLGIARGVRKMGRLELIAPLAGKELPRVSVIVPACNEAKTIAAGLRSLLAQDYTNLEIIVIDDRSTDGTGQVVEALQAEGAGLLLHRIGELPEGWLGKSHALQVGADLATGDYLLFTDADVILERSTVSRVMSHMRQGDLDHLPLIFANQGGTPLLDCLILELGLGLLFCFRPWRVRETASPFFMGVGAFNLLKRSAYRAIDGHRSFALHPIDDVMLGKLVKERGLRQDCLLALEHVSVPWYATVAEMARGLEKNGYAFLHYRLWLLPPLLLLLVVGNILPLWGAVFAAGAARGLWATAMVIKLVAFAFGLHRQGRPVWYVPGGLITPYITLFILLRSAWVVVGQGGIRWRESFYPLAQLKKSRALFW
jgi:glycosyltransferase involved in cell wall biosynthesis